MLVDSNWPPPESTGITEPPELAANATFFVLYYNCIRQLALLVFTDIVAQTEIHTRMYRHYRDEHET